MNWLQSNQHTVLDLFCGCGGMSWGLHKAGFQVLAGVDVWDTALRTFSRNHPEAVAFARSIHKDLTPEEVMRKLNIAVGDLSCLIGGPPCQGFSKNVPASGRFLEDHRNLLFRDFLGFVEATAPKVVVMENVAEIYNAYDGAVREEICSTLNRMGYAVAAKVLYAPDYGVPQRRRRCFFLASRTGISPMLPEAGFAAARSDDLFLAKQGHRSAWSCISDLPPLKNGEGSEEMLYPVQPQNEFQQMMRFGSACVYDHVTRRLKDKQFARISALAPGQAWKDLPKELQPRAGYSGAYGRLDFQMLAPTITRWVFHPGSGRYSHPADPRVLTIREVARLQSFSDDFRFTGTYTEKAGQVGNAVPPLFMFALSSSILNCLGERQAPVSAVPRFSQLVAA